MSKGLSSTGFERKRLDEIVSDIEANFKTVFGDNLNTSPESPDGQIIGLISGSLSDLWEIAQGSYNSFNPSAATGDALTNLVQLNGITRKPARSSTVSLILTGTDGTLIPKGSIVSTSDSNEKFTTDEDVTLLSGGNVSASSVVKGQITALAGTLTQIENPITGWDSVTNSLDAVVGSLEETDIELRARRKNSLALDAQSTIDAIFSDLSNVDFVTQVTVLGNDTNSVDANGLPPHSFQAIVVGGSDSDIGNSIWLNKPAGILSFGTETVAILDSQGISHDISFSRPTTIDIYVTVNLTKFANYPVNGDDLIKQAIVDYANGDLIDGRGFGLNDDVIYSELYTPINSIVGHQVDSLFIGTSASPTGEVNISIGLTEISNFTIAKIVVN